MSVLRSTAEHGSAPVWAVPAALVVSLMLAVVALTGCGGSSRDASEARVAAVVEEFSTPAGWTETGRKSEPARRVCLGANPCPSVRVEYSTKAPVTAAQLEQVISDSGWDLKLEGDCVVPTNVTGPGPVCAANGVVDGHDVTVTAVADAGDPAASGVTLFVAPRP